MTTGFDGMAGVVAARVMATMNADMEHGAVAALAPSDGESIVVVGFGPGAGLTRLLDRCRPRTVLGVDPSSVMVRAARRRLAGHPLGELVQLLEAPAADLPRNRGPFDAAVAVNSQQLWRPHGESVRALSRCLASGARLVTVTHEWAITKHGPLERWQAEVETDLARAGLGDARWTTQPYRTGRGVMLRSSKL